MFFHLCRSSHWRLVAPLHHIIHLDIITSRWSRPLACQGHLWVMKDLDLAKNLGDYCPMKNYAIDFFNILSLFYI